MGNTISHFKLNYEDVQYAVNNNYVIINTLSHSDNTCFIKNTINHIEEEDTINDLIHKGNMSSHIVIYGKNTNDDSVITKQNQLMKLGFTNVYIYIGGLFEWLCLQDIYSTEEFPTNIYERDILKYKPINVLNKLYLN
jgi:hypothetical protein|tara:strand:- start:72 stop:485 length:414 start_codon:yes stop_codon:yes gene_type:complete